MAKKDFSNLNTDIKETTKSFFSAETLKKIDGTPDKQRTRKKKENTKVKTITIRLTDEEYERMYKEVETYKRGTVTNYLMSAVREVYKW